MERGEVFDVIRRYANEALKSRAFVPGETYIPASAKSLNSEDIQYLIDAVLDLHLTHGRFAHEFECKLAEYHETKVPAVFVNSGSSALLMAMGVFTSEQIQDFGYEPLQKGDEVITVAANFPTAVNPIIQNGLTPVFVDIDEVTLNALPQALLNASTSKTRAIVLGHTLGNPFMASEISNWAEKNRIYLIEDCSDAIGSTYRGKKVGSFGHVSTFSFYPAHHMTTGEGGAALFKEASFRKIAQSLRDWGKDCWCPTGEQNTCQKRFDWKLGDLPYGYDHKYTYTQLGYNLKATDMQAALGVSQLKKLDQFNFVRKKNWAALNSGILSSPILKEHLRAAQPTPGSDPAWFGFVLTCGESINRLKLMESLESKKVGTRLLLAGNITKQPAFKNVNYRMCGKLINTNRVMEKAFWVANHPALDEAQINYMLETLESSTKEQL